MTQVFYCSTLFGAFSVAAAIDAGEFGAPDQRRVLVVSNNSRAPEASGTVAAARGFAAVRDRFDDICSLNDILAPQHPATWEPLPAETPMLGRYLSLALGLDAAPTELVVESIAVRPARTLADLLPDTPITVYSDGLMSYGPTRNRLPIEIYARIRRLLHLDLVPGLTPMLLREYDVPSQVVPSEAFRAVLDGVPGAVDAPAQPVDAMILGQYLSALGLMTAEHEAEQHAAMLRAVVARGATRVLFKPHPAAGPAHARELRAAAAGLDVTLEIAADADPAELTFRDRRPGLVVGCFSTALVTAARWYDIPVATMGTERVLARLTPYQNSNRIPATLVHATLPRLASDGTVTEPPPVDITALVDAVGYCMQPRSHAALHDRTAAYVAEHGVAPYFSEQRLIATEVYPPSLKRRAKSHAAVYVGAQRRAEIRRTGWVRAEILADRATRRWPRLNKRVPALFERTDERERDPRRRRP